MSFYRKVGVPSVLVIQSEQGPVKNGWLNDFSISTCHTLASADTNFHCMNLKSPWNIVLAFDNLPGAVTYAERMHECHFDKTIFAAVTDNETSLPHTRLTDVEEPALAVFLYSLVSSRLKKPRSQK